MASSLTEKRLHLTFRISILLKALHGMFEVLGGFFFLFINKAVLGLLVWLLTLGELWEDPQDFLAHYFINSANALSSQGQQFIALYLLGHGFIKLFVIVGLWKGRIWAYPTSIVVFSGFIVYQLYRYTYTHSIWLLLFTFFDVIVILLTVHEWRKMTPTKLS